MENITKIYVGVDVSKDSLSIHFYPLEEAFKIENSAKGMKLLLEKLAMHDVELITFESTGGYENLLMKYVNKNGYLFWQIDPRRIKYFIAAEGIRYKNDPNDARMIALFSYKNQQTYTKKPLSEEAQKLRAYFRRKQELREYIIMERTRLSSPSQELFKKNIEKLIKFLEKAIKKLDVEILSIIDNDKELTKKRKIMESIPGVGIESAMALIAEMPELGTVENKQAAALLGVAPYTQESGNYKGKSRTGFDGRQHPRSILYMGALSAGRFNPDLKIFYDRLKDAGKASKVAIIAVTRKLICLINTLLKEDRLWVDYGKTNI